MSTPEDDRLDALLNAAPTLRASAELVDRIVASAPSPRPVRRWRGWLLPAGLGAGLASACAAGLLVGVQLSHTSASDTDATVAAIAGDDAAVYGEDA